jgi:hypothetical protein
MTRSISTSFEPLASTYRSKQKFLVSLPRWRQLLQKLNWQPTVELKVQRYALQQQMLQDEKEIAQLQKETTRIAQINSRLAHFEQEHLSGSTPPPSTGGSSL